MSIIRALQESGTSLFPPKLLGTKHSDDYENLKEIIKEKNVIITNHTEKINDLENHLAELQEKYAELQKELQTKNEIEEVLTNSGMQNIVECYEKFISQITEEHALMKEERNIACTHLANLEFAFADIVSKYERLKDIVKGYQMNQEQLLIHIDAYKEAVNALQQEYKDFKKYAYRKVGRANVDLNRNDREPINSVLTKVKELGRISVMTSKSIIGDGDTENKDDVLLTFAPDL